MSGATIRLTATAPEGEPIEHLQRAVKLAQDLAEMGFTVTLSGDVYIAASWPKPEPDPEPDAG